MGSILKFFKLLTSFADEQSIPVLEIHRRSRININLSQAAKDTATHPPSPLASSPSLPPLSHLKERRKEKGAKKTRSRQRQNPIED